MDQQYSKWYSDARLLVKLKEIIRRIGTRALREIVTLVLMLKKPEIPLVAKMSIIAILGYLICPFDLIPDFIPGGLIDDLAAISLLLAQLEIYRTFQMKEEVDEFLKQHGMCD